MSAKNNESEIQAKLRALLPDRPTGGIGEALGGWRDRIDLLDRLLLTLLNERATCANEIGQMKKRLGLPVYVPSREEEVIANVRGSNEGPLPDAAVQHLFERIIDEIRSLERRSMQDEPGTPDERSEDK
ncbi:MAG: chorismate mutase [Rhodothermales bacterium]|jgi:chorismate mutase